MAQNSSSRFDKWTVRLPVEEVIQRN
jgi:hypothetical protein